MGTTKCEENGDVRKRSLTDVNIWFSVSNISGFVTVTGQGPSLVYIIQRTV
jgi:hypothetical protein